MIDRANHEFYKPHFKQMMTPRQLLKWNLRFGSTSYFFKDFISNDLEKIKDSLIIAAIEEGTHKKFYDHNYKDLQNNF